ncbi:E3 ubiquitin-protein ligase [Wickerhamomyces ciferrii]|uniref:E3 ubiquitin protein ligase n=1 Tax=Wickerhamomyces ciferrii (strain ATCC 14091 / BCRC 22168 / CBS 111 / JCM 3599 / NBRC 0793 / NRRL Y-1031 F-60-10) TaxID=1206466 RepID=K0KVX4_WICCF|nr:E3 ubiquitin-protein ligase [Wickerhamomyces ciferrii]CCH46127.1 E3 ubiquitin-protein ligase [Wickerhamomyces ciferrii]
MSEKRELNDVVNGSDQTQKRRKVDEISEDGPLTQEDVVYFQKEAIFRQMNLYRSKVNQVHKQMQTLDEQNKSTNSKLLVLSNWIDQFIEFITSVVPLKELESKSEYKILFTDSPNDIKDNEFIESLNQKKTQLSDLINKIIQNSGAIPDEIKENLNTINSKYHDLKIKNQKITNEYSLLKKNFDNLTIDFQNLVKTSDRLNSITLKRANGTKSEDVSRADTPKAEQLEISIPKDQAESQLNSNGINNTVNSDEVEYLKKQVDEFKATIEAQQKNIDENLELNKSLNSKLVEATTKNQTSIESQSTVDVAKFEDLTNEHKDLNIKYKEIIQKHDSLLERYNALESEKSSDNDLLNSKFEVEKQSLESNFGKLEFDLIRIRTARDELLSKISVLEAEKSGLEVTKQLQALIEAQKEQIETISLEKKLEDKIGGSDINDVETLKKNNTILTNELKEFEKAFKNLQNTNIKKLNSSVDSETVINKLKIEKTKADQKYFAAMRSKDSILQENKTLKAQNGKLNELIQNLKDSEALSTSRFENLDKQLKNLKKVEFFRGHEVDRYVQQISELEKNYKFELNRNKEIQTLLDDFKGKNDELLKLKSEYSIKVSKLESNVKTQDKLINRFKSTGVLEDQNEADSFRSLIYCSLCSKNWKNTAIKVCGHVFCEECAKERIAARMRKCPSCNKQFSTNDLLTIHL